MAGEYNPMNETQASTSSTNDISRGQGMMDNYIGATYQKKLLIAMVCHVAKLIEKKEFEFELTSEDAKTGIFDDIGLRFNNDGQSGALFIQAKHKRNKNNTISWDDLTSMEKKAPFAISKYLNSFLQEREKWDKQNEQPVLVLCTNIGLAEEVKAAVVDYEFGQSIVDSVLKSISSDAYKLNLDINSSLYKHLKENDEFGSLAKQIAWIIYHKKEVDFRKSLLQKYRYVIEQNITKEQSKPTKCYEVDKDFFDSNDEFKKAFEKEYKLHYMLDDIQTKGINLGKDYEFKYSNEKVMNLESSDYIELAKELARHIYQEKLLNFADTIFSNYRQFIEANIVVSPDTKDEQHRQHKHGNRKDKQHNLGNTKDEKQKVNTSFLKDKKNLEFQMEFKEEYLNMLEKDKDKIWKDIRDKGIHLKKQNQTERCNLPTQLNDEDLKKFSKSFVLLCNTNHEESAVVASIRKNRLLPSKIQSFISSELTYDKLLKSILDWMTKKGGQCLKRQDILDMFNYIASSLRFTQLQDISNSYCNEMGDMELQYMPDKVEGKKLYQKVQNWLKENQNEENRFNVTFERCSNLALVFAVLKHSKGEWEHLFLKSDWLMKPQSCEDLLNIFRTIKFPLILVVDCKQETTIVNCLKDESSEYRRMILIVEQSASPYLEEDIFIEDLTEQSRKHVFQQNSMLCGTKISNQELFHAGDSMNMVHELKRIPNGTGINRNINNESFEEIKEMYIPRSWMLCSSESGNEISSEEFWRRKWMPKEIPNTLTSGASDEITIEDFLKHFGSHNMRYDNIVADEHQEHIDPPGFETNNTDQGAIENKSHVILNEAGSGKTFYMTRLANELQSRLCSNDEAGWIIKFNLNEYSAEFDQFSQNQLDENGRLNADDAIRQLFQLIYLTFAVLNKSDPETDKKRLQAKEAAKLISFSDSTIQLNESKITQLTIEQFVLLKIFASKFSNREIFILMDGFDEVTPLYKEVALNLLSVLATVEGVRKIYLSSRPYGFRNELQLALKDCLFYRLVEFNSDDQCKYIHRFLKEKLDGYKSFKEQDQKRIFQITTRLLCSFLKNFMKLPLFLFMGLELLIPLFDELINVQDNTISLTIMEKCKHIFAPLNMIESFVDQKLIISMQKTGAIKYYAGLKTILYRELERVRNTLSCLALIAVMNEEVNNLLSDDDRNDAFVYMDKIRNGSEKSGICEAVVKNVPVFIHRLFAEYFTALWFFNQTSNQKTRDKVRDFIKHHIFETNERKEIKFFLDSMICKRKQLHLAILDHSSSKVSSLLDTNPGLINETDAWGRSPLHLAVSYGSKENDDVVSLLLQSADEPTINAKDTYFQWSVLDYAHVSDKLNGKEVHFELYFVLKLLKMGASINNDETFTRFCSQDYAEMIAEALPFAFHFTHELVPTLGETSTTNIMENLFKKVELRIKLHGTMQISTNKLFTMVKSYDVNLAKRFEHKNMNQGAIPYPELFAIADSTVFVAPLRKNYLKMLILYVFHCIFDNSVPDLTRFGMALLKTTLYCHYVSLLILLLFAIYYQDYIFIAYFLVWISGLFFFKFCIDFIAQYQKIIKAAYEFRSINALRFFYAKCSWVTKLVQPATFEQEILLLLLLMHKDERLFKSRFHRYCTRHNIGCLEENELQQCIVVLIPDADEKRVSMQGELWRNFPVEFKMRNEIGMDSGTEFLLSRALQANDESIVEYLLLKTKKTVHNQIIKSLVKNCEIDWRCQASFHFLTSKSSDLNSADENGRTLLHFAVEQGCFNLVKCLIEHKNFKATDRNAKEKNWNAFFYCVYEFSENSELRKNIFSYIIQKNAFYDCFSVLDLNGKSVFYYAVKNNQSISDYIVQRKFSIQLKDFDSGRIHDLVKLLKSSGFNAEEMLEYLSNIFSEDATLCKDIIHALQKNEMLYYTDQNNRNLLHISIKNNWFFMVMCLVESIGFDGSKTNEQDKNWNSFFYCVSERTSESTAIRKQIFLFLLDECSDDSVYDLDSEGKSVFFYATETNTEIAKIIFRRQNKRMENRPFAERISVMMQMLQNATLNAYQKLQYLEENNLIDERSVEIICDSLNITKELSFKDKQTGRNLLQTAIWEGWFILTKCLIENYGLEPETINGNEFNWNAFFYCVSNREKPVEKLNIFTYLIEKYPMDCFNQLDAKGKSVFSYATSNNGKIAEEILKIESKLAEPRLNENQTSILMNTLRNSRLNAFDKLKILEKKNLINVQSGKTICDYLKTAGDLEKRDKKNGRNLLHSAILNGWFVLAKCLVEHYGFIVLEVNEKEYSWNSFFYCVINDKKSKEKLNIFVYLMLKSAMDFFGQLDTKGKSVFHYANNNNEEISQQIFNREWKLTENLSIEKRTHDMMLKMQNSTITTAYEKIYYFAKNNLIDEPCVKLICDYMKATGELNFKDKKSGRNLLQTAIMEGWLIVTKCLIEHYGFDVKEINEKDSNRNGFFYCVCNAEKPSEKLNIFTYLMEKHQMDCFNQLDSKGKSVFWHATRNNEGIGMKIFKRQCELTENLPIEERIRDLMGKLENTTLNAYGKLRYLEENNVIDERSVKGICDCMKTTGDLIHINSTGGQNLLFLAIYKGWLIVTQCLIEHYGFDVKEINEKENNWNAFFYCVCNTEKPSEKLNIFTYLMEKYQMDCFNQLDSKGKSVFWYATSNNREIGLKIFKRQCELTENLPIEERICDLMGKLQNSNLYAYGKLRYLEENNVIDEKSVKSICDYMKNTGDLSHMNKNNGQNLLQIVIMEGMVFVTKCLIEHYGFDIMEINEKEKNWNAFFYCVSNANKPTEKLNIFSYLMEKYQMDWINQLDSAGKSIFYFAHNNNKEIAREIVKRELNENLPRQDQTSHLISKLQGSLGLGFTESKYIFEEYIKVIGDLT